MVFPVLSTYFVGMSATKALAMWPRSTVKEEEDGSCEITFNDRAEWESFAQYAEQHNLDCDGPF